MASPCRSNGDSSPGWEIAVLEQQRFSRNYWRAVFGLLSPTLRFPDCIKAQTLTAPISPTAATPCEKN